MHKLCISIVVAKYHQFVSAQLIESWFDGSYNIQTQSNVNPWVCINSLILTPACSLRQCCGQSGHWHHLLNFLAPRNVLTKVLTKDKYSIYRLLPGPSLCKNIKCTSVAIIAKITFLYGLKISGQWLCIHYLSWNFQQLLAQDVWAHYHEANYQCISIRFPLLSISSLATRNNCSTNILPSRYRAPIWSHARTNARNGVFQPWTVACVTFISRCNELVYDLLKNYTSTRSTIFVCRTMELGELSRRLPSNLWSSKTLRPCCAWIL
jgi:hypothetical protein